MIITNASHNIITETDPLKKIEQIARICYKSEDKISENSDIKMVKSLIARKHTAMLEHANVILEVSKPLYKYTKRIINELQSCTFRTYDPANDGIMGIRSYLRFTENLIMSEYRYLISGNLRAWYDYFTNPWTQVYKPLFDAVNDATRHIFDDIEVPSFLNTHDSLGDIKVISDMQELTNGERMVHENISVKFTVDRGVTHELVRMREASFAQESTRYCNYSKDKFGNEITVIRPCFKDWDENRFALWQTACENAEKSYFALLKAGATPQEARDVLPTSVKSEIAMTSNLNEWYHTLNLRACDATGAAHPQMHEVMIPLLGDLKESHPFAFGVLTLPES